MPLFQLWLSLSLVNWFVSQLPAKPEMTTGAAAVVAKLNKFEDDHVLKELLNIVIDLSKTEKNDTGDQIVDFAKIQIWRL